MDISSIYETFTASAAGAGIVLIVQYIVSRYKRLKKLRTTAWLIQHHLKKIKKNLHEHINLIDDKAEFSETQYTEVVIGDFLYSLFIENLDVIGNVEQFEKTIDFFHEYKINMGTLKVRFDTAKHNDMKRGNSTEIPRCVTHQSVDRDTFYNLSGFINGAICELDDVAKLSLLIGFLNFWKY